MNPRKLRRSVLTHRQVVVLVSIQVSALLFVVGILVYGHVTAPETIPVPKLQPVPGKSSVKNEPKPHKITSVTIRSSPAVQIYIPTDNSSSVQKAINSPVLPMPTSCQQVIEPPLDGPQIADVYQCMDYGSLPGTDSPSLTVLAGHSSNYVHTVFDNLFVQGKSLMGRKVMIRTRASGNRWLIYRVEHVYMPLKPQLPFQTEIWGKSGGSTAGRLILVTCIQRAIGLLSQRNFVVVAQFAGVTQPTSAVVG